MAILPTSLLSFASASLILTSTVHASSATIFLAPEQDIVLPSSDSASNPLEWLGANSPYFTGENPNDTHPPLAVNFRTSRYCHQ
jgi:hypothetical protein